MLWQERGVVNSVVELVSSSVGLVVYRREEGEEIMNTKQTKHHKIYQVNTRCSVCPNAVVGDTGEGGENIRESIPGVSCFRAEEPEGESYVFDRSGGCGGRTGCVSGFVSSF